MAPTITKPAMSINSRCHRLGDAPYRVPGAPSHIPFLNPTSLTCRHVFRAVLILLLTLGLLAFSSQRGPGAGLGRDPSARHSCRGRRADHRLTYVSGPRWQYVWRRSGYPFLERVPHDGHRVCRQFLLPARAGEVIRPLLLAGGRACPPRDLRHVILERLMDMVTSRAVRGFVLTADPATQPRISRGEGWGPARRGRGRGRPAIAFAAAATRTARTLGARRRAVAAGEAGEDVAALWSRYAGLAVLRQPGRLLSRSPCRPAVAVIAAGIWLTSWPFIFRFPLWFVPGHDHPRCRRRHATGAVGGFHAAYQSPSSRSSAPGRSRHRRAIVLTRSRSAGHPPRAVFHARDGLSLSRAQALATTRARD